MYYGHSLPVFQEQHLFDFLFVSILPSILIMIIVQLRTSKEFLTFLMIGTDDSKVAWLCVSKVDQSLSTFAQNLILRSITLALLFQD